MSGLRLLHVQTGCPAGGFSAGQALEAYQFPAGFNLVCVRGELSETVVLRTAANMALVEHFGDRAASLRAVRTLRSADRGLPIVLAAWEGSEEFVIDAFNAGISKYLKLPCQTVKLHTFLNDIAQTLPARVMDDNPVLQGHSLVGDSAAMCELRRYIAQVAPSESNVLITGETGTGKELVAQLIKENSARRNRPFICLNSAAIPDALIESELFGYEKGAFTGAFGSQEGKLAAANHGTIFFDEIGDVSPGVQAKLLRAIESKKIYRLGSNRSCDLDVRILAASNQDLEVATQQNRFRTDLYYRLNVIRIEVPPLREHVEDLPVLVDLYLKRFSKKFQKQVAGLNPSAMDLLFAYPWPGNIRELRNVMEATLVNLPNQREHELINLPVQVTRHLLRSSTASGNRTIHAVTERTEMLRALNGANWNRTEAARRLQWSRMTLYRKMIRYQVTESKSDRL